MRPPPIAVFSPRAGSAVVYRGSADALLAVELLAGANVRRPK